MVKNREWYVGGVSAGHIMPLRALAQQRRAQGAIETRFIVADTPLDARLTRDMPEVDRLTILRSRGIGSRTLRAMLGACKALILDVIAVARLIYRERPCLVLTTGGGVALPVVLIARLLAIPVKAYELNAVPGRMIRASRWMGCQMYCVFPQALAACGPRAQRVPYPYYRRAGITAPSLVEQPDMLHILILGGSQGSGWLNQTMPAIMARVMDQEPSCPLVVIHQAGSAASEVMLRYQQQCPQAAQRIRVIDYEPQIDRLYRTAHLVVCRAGSGTLHELDEWPISAFVIPLPRTVTDHQQANAQAWCESPSPRAGGNVRTWLAQEALMGDSEPLVAWLREQARAWQCQDDRAPQ